MKYISAEQFLEQPKEVQKVLLDWWKPEMYDLFARDFRSHDANSFANGIYQGCIQDKETKISASKCSFIPLLTEGQLREFIEDKTKTHLDVNYYGESTEIYTMSDLFGEYSGTFSDEETLLEIYWQIACEVVKEESKCK